METIKSQISAIVQSAIDGKTSAIEANVYLMELRGMVNKGLNAIDEQVFNEIQYGRVHKTDNEDDTIPYAF